MPTKIFFADRIRNSWASVTNGENVMDHFEK
jgi:hypothetical protein